LGKRCAARTSSLRIRLATGLLSDKSSKPTRQTVGTGSAHELPCRPGVAASPALVDLRVERRQAQAVTLDSIRRSGTSHMSATRT
jgi:hypothetical protein